MEKWQELVKAAENERYHSKVNIILAAKRYIDTNHAVRKSPCGWMSFHGPKEDPKWAEYYKLKDEYIKASSDLWMATDVEFAEDGFRNHIWEWRYWKVMARKCCWYQTSTGNTDKAVETMAELDIATRNMMYVCGLEEHYKSPSHYIEEQFPNLKR